MAIDDWARAIASIESAGSGGYSALGPVTERGNRAYGKYQVMDFNIGPWTEKYVGRRMTPQEFLASPEAQEAVFRGEFGGNVEKYGSPQEAASVWFTGQPMSRGANRKDILGTTGSGYIAKFNRALGNVQANYATPTIMTKGGQAVEPDQIKKDAMAQSTGVMGMAGAQPSASQRPSFKERFRDPDFWNELALTFHSMSSFPNEAAIRSLERRVSTARERKKEQDQINKTVAFFEKSNMPQLVELARFAPSAALNLYGQMTKPVKEGEAINQYRLAVEQGYPGTFMDYKIALAEAGRPITGNQEKAWDKAMGEWGAETYAKVQQEAAAADKMLAQAAELERLMLDPNFVSGGLAEQKMAMKKIVEALGGDPAKVESMEAFQAVSSQLVLDSMGGSLGAGFSEGDRKFVERMQPSLSTSKAGNQLIIQMTRKIADRKRAIAQFADQYVQANGRIDAKFQSALREWADQNPLFASGNAAGYFE